MQNMHQVQKQGAVVQTKEVWYTAQTLAGADISDNLQIGYPVALDYANITSGKETEQIGTRVTKPEANNIHLFEGIITRLSKPNEPNTPQWVTIQSSGPVQAFCDANATIGVTWLKCVAGWALQANSAASDLDDTGEAVGVAGETKNTDTTNANALVLLR